MQAHGRIEAIPQVARARFPTTGFWLSDREIRTAPATLHPNQAAPPIVARDETDSIGALQRNEDGVRPFDFARTDSSRRRGQARRSE